MVDRNRCRRERVETAASRPDRDRRTIRWRTVLRLAPVALVLVTYGGLFLVADVLAVVDATRLADHGSPVVVSGSQVHLTWESGKRGRVKTVVDGVRVRYAGAATVDVPLLHVTERDVPGAVPSRAAGWGPSSSQTGYQAPFAAHILRDGDGTVGMADADIEHWRDGTVLWRDGLALLVVLFVVVTWWLFSPLRVPGRRHTGSRVVGPSRPA